MNQTKTAIAYADLHDYILNQMSQTQDVLDMLHRVKQLIESEQYEEALSECQKLKIRRMKCDYQKQ